MINLNTKTGKEYFELMVNENLEGFEKRVAMSVIDEFSNYNTDINISEREGFEGFLKSIIEANHKSQFASMFYKKAGIKSSYFVSKTIGDLKELDPNFNLKSYDRGFVEVYVSENFKLTYSSKYDSDFGINVIVIEKQLDVYSRNINFDFAEFKSTLNGKFRIEEIELEGDYEVRIAGNLVILSPYK